jgi:O-antigen/teichoic acid export membrane protein
MTDLTTIPNSTEPTPLAKQSPTVRGGASSLSGAQIIRRAFRMITFLLAARLLGPATFGIYILLMTVTEMIAVISGAGYVDYLSREVASQPTAAGWLATRLTQTRAIYIFCGAIIAILGLRLLHFPNSLLICAAALCVALLPRAVLESCQGLLRGSMQFSALPAIEIVQGGALLGTAAVLLVSYHSLTAVIVAEIAANVAGMVVAAIFSRRWWRTSLRPGWTIPHFLKQAVAFNLYPFIANVYDRIDVIVIARLAGNVATGLYSLPYRAFATLLILPYGLMGALLPKLSTSGWDAHKERSCCDVMRLLYVLALTVIFGTQILAKPLVHLVLGPSYAPSTVVLQVLVWAAVPMFLNFAMNTVLLATGNEKLFLITASVCSIFNLVANLILIPRFSINAAAAVTVMTELLLFGMNFFFVRRSLGRVPLPQRIGTLTVVSLGLLTAFYVARAHAPELLVAVLALVLFSACVIFDNTEWTAARRALNVE